MIIQEDKFAALEKEFGDYKPPYLTATNILANDVLVQLRMAFKLSDCKQVMVVPIVHGQPSFYGS